MEEPEEEYHDDEYQEEDGQEGMRPLIRALLLNLVIVLLYTAVLVVFEGRNEGLFVSGLFMLGQSGINFVAMIVMFIMGKKEWGLGLLLSGLILGVVGFSACVAGFTI